MFELAKRETDASEVNYLYRGLACTNNTELLQK